MIRKTALLGLFSVVFAGESFAVSVSELSSTWIPKNGKLTAASFEKMIQVFQEDPETNELLRDVSARLGASNPIEILKILRTCTENNEGLFSRLTHHRLRFLPEDGTEGSWPEEAGRAIATAIEVETSRNEIAEYATTLDEVSICFRSGRELLSSFLTLVHELTHFRGYQLLTEDEDILSFADEESFIERELMRPGGEFDAYAAEYRIHLRLKNRTGEKTEFLVERFFDSSGNLKDVQGLKNEILDGEFKYRKVFRSRFVQSVNSAHYLAAWRRDQYQEEIDQVNSVIEKTSSSAEKTRAYLEKARRDAYPAAYIRDAEEMLQAFSAKLRNYQRRLALLNQEIEGERSRMQAIRERFGAHLKREELAK